MGQVVARGGIAETERWRGIDLGDEAAPHGLFALADGVQPFPLAEEPQAHGRRPQRPRDQGHVAGTCAGAPQEGVALAEHRHVDHDGATRAGEVRLDWTPSRRRDSSPS